MCDIDRDRMLLVEHVWVTAQNEHIPVSELSDFHLNNILNMFGSEDGGLSETARNILLAESCKRMENRKTIFAACDEAKNYFRKDIIMPMNSYHLTLDAGSIDERIAIQNAELTFMPNKNAVGGRNIPRVSVGFSGDHVYLLEAALTPTKIIMNGPATIVFWADNTKTVVKVSGDDKDKQTPYAGFCACLAKKLFGSNSKVHRIMNDLLETQATKVELAE